MATVTGTLSDFGVGEIRGLSPRIIFSPSGPATGSVNYSILLASRPIVVIPDAFGQFEVDLAPNDVLIPVTYYTVSIEWMVPDMFGPENGYIGTDYLQWKITVPSAGGPIGGMIATPSNPSQVWIGPTPPPGDVLPGTWWLNTTTGDLLEWS